MSRAEASVADGGHFGKLVKSIEVHLDYLCHPPANPPEAIIGLTLRESMEVVTGGSDNHQIPGREGLLYFVPLPSHTKIFCMKNKYI